MAGSSTSRRAKISNPIGVGRFDFDAVLDNLVLALGEIDIEKILEGTELGGTAVNIVNGANDAT